MATATDKHAHIIKKVNELKDSAYGATALKIELEGQLRRGANTVHSTPRRVPRSNNGDCLECTEGMRTCSECDGEYRNINECYGCDGGGCDDCGDTGEVDCRECDEGQARCWTCLGNYHVDPATIVEPETVSYNFTTDVGCFNFLMNRLEQHGLARKLTAEERIELNRDRAYPTNYYGVDAEYVPAGALKFAKFYYDGSVDSEFTATLALNDPENVFLAPKLIEAWNDLVTAVGNGCATEGAGMHMALLRSRDYIYPDQHRYNDGNSFLNFGKSMQMLLPAMFLLGSATERSRGLAYRRPEIGHSSHRSAIDFRAGVLEYRLFETCYDHPERILDNVVVMANTIKYWSKTYKPSGIEKITNSLRFGIDGNGEVSRFFTTIKHIDVLNAGLEKLKPAYYTIRQVKEQRNFKLTKRDFNGLDKKNKLQAELEYKEYEERFAWRLECMYKEYEWSTFASANTPKTEAEKKQIAADAKKRAAERVANERATKTPLARFIERRLTELANINEGSYTLSV